MGTRFADETTCSYRKGASFNFPDTKLIHVDIDPGEIGKHTGLILNNRDLRSALEQIIAARLKNGRSRYLEEIEELKFLEAELEKIRSVNTGKITISQLIGEMKATLPANTIMSYLIRKCRPGCSGVAIRALLQPYERGFSTMGWSLPAAMERKAGLGQPVVAFMGDGDFMMVMQELATMAR